MTDQNSNEDSDPAVSRVTVFQRTVIPPNSVKLVQCKTDKQMHGYMVEPITQETALIPRLLYKKGTDPKPCMLNLSDRNAILKNKDVLGEA